MTELQKKQISKMREQGLKYGQISEFTGIAESTIKSYCIKYGIQKGEDPSDRNISVCPWCGNPIPNVKGKKPKKFCSDRCRRTWWKEHPERRHKKPTAIYSFTCAYCGKKFEAYGNSHRKYCSHECYIKDRFGGDNE